MKLIISNVVVRSPNEHTTNLRGYFDECDVFDVCEALVLVRVFGVRLEPHGVLGFRAQDGVQRQE